MTKIYSYILRFDDGAAPNPFWDVCTLAICKPAIRRTAQIGDWVIGTGSKNAICNDGMKHDLSGCLVYAMKITDKKSLADYDLYCLANLQDKIPVPGHEDWRMRMGDCIYFDEGRTDLEIRPGSVHGENHRPRDQRGKNAIISNHFYYFGENPVVIPSRLTTLIKKNQGHLKIENEALLFQFEEWISTFEQNKIYGNPQLMHDFDKPNCDMSGYCSKEYIVYDENETEEVIRKC